MLTESNQPSRCNASSGLGISENTYEMMLSLQSSINTLSSSYGKWERKSLIRILIEGDDSSFRKRCGNYILIYQILDRLEFSSEKAKKRGFIDLAHALLDSKASGCVHVHPPKELSSGCFIELMIEKAEYLAEKQETIPRKVMKCALELIESFQELKSAPFKENSIPIHDSLQKFIISWQTFAHAYLQERLLTLKGI